MIAIANETQSRIIHFRDDFDKYAKDVLHIDNPFIEYYNNFSKYTRKEGTTLILDLDKANALDRETKAEREEWIRLENEYVANRISRELGYEVLQTYNDGKYVQDVIPCTGASRQCNMDCKYFGQGECPTLV